MCEINRDECTPTTSTYGLVSQVPVTDDGGAMITDDAAACLFISSSAFGPECVVHSSVGDSVITKRVMILQR